MASFNMASLNMKQIGEFFKSKKTVLLKGVAVGTVGAVAMVAKNAINARNGGRSSVFSFPVLNDVGNAILSKDAHIASLCNRLQPYSIFDSYAHDSIVVQFAQLVYLNTETAQKNTKLKISTPREASIVTSRITEAIRMLRARFAFKMQNSPKAMADFDDIASGMQQVCIDTTFNINMNFAFYQNK